MPKGFNRRGTSLDLIPDIFESIVDKENTWQAYDNLNIPVWKYLDTNGNTIIRGLSPRINEPFIHIILEDCLDKIDCVEITDEFLEGID